VNVPVARNRLYPLGVEVVHASSERTPWSDDSFDLVLSRHEAIIPAEIGRILRPGGVFLTQQVGNEWWQEITPFFPERTAFPDHYTRYRQEFEAAGLTVASQKHSWRSAYGSLGEVAFMLLVTPWDLPDFDPVHDIDRLLAVEEACRTEDGIVLTQTRYLMTARKPPG
jgi:SAM-dependent methyltransferase